MPPPLDDYGQYKSGTAGADAAGAGAPKALDTVLFELREPAAHATGAPTRGFGARREREELAVDGLSDLFDVTLSDEEVSSPRPEEG